ncbi:MAG: protein phosphatase 2C domain-containing protein [Candidatus Paceibacterota bacterium]|jgi:serine/threonine protein phosphatase PrpC
MTTEGNPENTASNLPEEASTFSFGGQRAEESKEEKKGLGQMNTGELEDFLRENVPAQYEGMSATAIVAMHSAEDVPFYLNDPNGERRNAEIRLRQQVEAAFDLLEEKQRELRWKQSHKQDAKGAEAVKSELGIGSAPVAESEKDIGNLASSLLDNVATHRIESVEKGITVTFDNSEHEQDAFAIKGDTFVVCDGASSYGRSGVVSRILSGKLAELSEQGLDFKEILGEKRMEEILSEIATDPEFKDFEYEHGVRNPNNLDAGLCTVLLAKLNKEKKKIEYASIGDSPLVIIDTDPDGTVHFEIANDDVDGKKITETTFTDPDVAEDLKNPATYLVGIDREGKPRLKDLSTTRTGTIEYKERRTVMLATDFFTKMMALSPQMIDTNIERARVAGKENLVKLLLDIQANTKQANNMFAGEKFNPEVFLGKEGGEDKFKKDLRSWKDIPAHSAGRDDMTMIAIDMDQALK